MKLDLFHTNRYIHVNQLLNSEDHCIKSTTPKTEKEYCKLIFWDKNQGTSNWLVTISSFSLYLANLWAYLTASWNWPLTLLALCSHQYWQVPNPCKIMRGFGDQVDIVVYADLPWPRFEPRLRPEPSIWFGISVPTWLSSPHRVPAPPAFLHRLPYTQISSGLRVTELVNRAL